EPPDFPHSPLRFGLALRVVIRARTWTRQRDEHEPRDGGAKDEERHGEPAPKSAHRGDIPAHLRLALSFLGHVTALLREDPLGLAPTELWRDEEDRANEDGWRDDRSASEGLRERGHRSEVG